MNTQEIDRLEQKAKQGDVDAQNELGWIYREGKGIAQNDKKAVGYFRKAAKQGHAEAQARLGDMYYEGRGARHFLASFIGLLGIQFLGSGSYLGDINWGRSQNYEEAMRWYRYREAVKWYRKAAEQGYAMAQYRLGFMYYFGRAVEDVEQESKSDSVNGNEVFYIKEEVSYTKEHEDLVYSINGICKVFRRPPARRGVSQNYEKALLWYRKAAEQGHAQAQFNLGAMYALGQGIAQDNKEAIRWLHKVAEYVDVETQFYLGKMYDKKWTHEKAEESFPRDDEQVVFWYHKVAEQGHANTQFKLGEMYAEGRGVAKDDEEALRWHYKAAEHGHVTAQHNLGFKYLFGLGQGVTQDSEKAIKWFCKAAGQGCTYAQHSLGSMYERGHGIPQDFVRAHMWYNLAAGKGNNDAKESLDRIAKSMPSEEIAEAQKRARKCLESDYENC